MVGCLRSRTSIFGNEIFRARTVGVGVLSPELISQYGVSGPIARASGVDFDLRRDDPYLAYDELLADGVLRVPTRAGGRLPCPVRPAARPDQGLPRPRRRLHRPDRPRCRKDRSTYGCPKILKAPEGHTYCWTENPLGINGYFLVSRGEKTPWRLKLRSASFNNISVLPQMLPGCVVADMIAILGSMFFVVGDIDK